MEAIWPIVLICLAIPVLRLLMGVRRYQPPAQEYHREDYQEQEPVRYQQQEDLPGGGARPEVDYWEQRAFQRANREKERER